jgi:hypothetical protein
MIRQLKNRIKSVRKQIKLQLHYLSLAQKSPQQVFTEIYTEKKWGGGDASSFSGPGSSLDQTNVVREALPMIIEELNCKSLIDVPCGDFFWMKTVTLDNVEYIGGDIVADLIEKNQKLYSGGKRRFILVDLLQGPLPKSDLVLCRDCLGHFSYMHIFLALTNIKRSGAEYFLTTTFNNRGRNENIVTGAWRPINLQIPPFNFPSPMKLIDEKCPKTDHQDKSLGLWKISDIPEY